MDIVAGMPRDHICGALRLAESRMSGFDLVVVGTGRSGTAAALRCSQAGRRVAIVDERPYGGTCALRGCDPKKVLVGAAELIDWAQRMQGSGIAGARADRLGRTDALQANVYRSGSASSAKRTCAKRESPLFHGVARFAGPASMTVAGEPLQAEHFVLATGARPATLQLAGEEHLITSTDFLELQICPSASRSSAAVTSRSSSRISRLAPAPRPRSCNAVRAS